jgi:hypothetical protein
MRLADYISEIKLELTGGVLELEIPDTTISQLVNKAFREIQRYIDIPKFVTVPFSKCIDLEGWKHSSILKVYRAEGFDSTSVNSSGLSDPMYMQQWQIFSNGNTMYNLNNYILNYASYATLVRLKNTLSTDMSWKEDKQGNKLYINCSSDFPTNVTIEYIPVYESVEEVEDDYWTDKIARLALALTKITLGRIRTYATQSNAIWALDGDTLLTEGNTEAAALRQELVDNMNFYVPID